MGKEQADTEVMLRQVELGQKIKKRQDTKKKQRKDQIYNEVATYNDIEDIYQYLKNIGYNVNF